MAGNLPVPQGVEAKIVWSRSGVPYALNILHFRHTVAQTHTQTRANTLDSLIKTAFATSAQQGQVHTTVSLSRVESRHMDQNTDPWFVGAGAPVSGTGTGDLLPLYVGFVVTQKTGLRGRSFNGRVYLTGYSEAANDATGQILPAGASAANNFIILTNQEALAQLGFTAAVLSRWTTPAGSPPNTPPIERNPPLLTDVSTVINSDLRWDVQRRRIVPGI